MRTRRRFVAGAGALAAGLFGGSTAAAKTDSKTELTPLVTSIKHAPTIKPELAARRTNIYAVSDIGGAIEIAPPHGAAAADGQKIEFRLKDDGTGRELRWNSVYASTGTVAVPRLTSAGIKLRVGFEWDAADRKWYCLGVS